MPSTLAILATAAITLYGLLHLLLHYTQDAREPPAIETTIPFLGTMIGLSRKKSKYYLELRDKYNLPIYTIRMPGARLYVVNSTSLITAVQRRSQILAFPPIEAKFTVGLCGSSEAANAMLDPNANGEEGTWGYLTTFHDMIHAALAPGPELDAMNRVMAQKVSASIDRINDRKVVNLFQYIKHEIALATTDSVYGPHNPFDNTGIVDDFWNFQEGIMTFIMGLPPSIFAKEAFRAREAMVRAFVKYFEDESYKSGSGLVQSRFQHSAEHNIPLNDIARFEVANTIALLTNTAPASFWMVYHMYSDPTVLEECRHEVSKIVSSTTTRNEAGEEIKVNTIDMIHVKTSCPILLSTMQEALRTHSVGISTRMVTEDHLLDGRYLLKKGNTVMIPGPVQHTSSSWGSNPSSFNHRRFLPENRRHNPIAYRSFGGGTTLCPGRHFASTEILAFAAMLILRYDITPKAGKWVHLKSDNAALWETTPVPESDIQVTISRRASEDAKARWRVLISDSDKAMPLSFEDM